MGKYYIKFGISDKPNAGSKAMRDIMDLLNSQGYKAVLSLPTDANKVLKIIDIPLSNFYYSFQNSQIWNINIFCSQQCKTHLFTTFYATYAWF